MRRKKKKKRSDSDSANRLEMSFAFRVEVKAKEILLNQIRLSLQLTVTNDVTVRKDVLV